TLSLLGLCGGLVQIGRECARQCCPHVSGERRGVGRGGGRGGGPALRAARHFVVDSFSAIVEVVSARRPQESVWVYAMGLRALQQLLHHLLENVVGKVTTVECVDCEEAGEELGAVTRAPLWPYTRVLRGPRDAPDQAPPGIKMTM
ncbi:hypothetical protein HW555_008623, partial [Spodoptera exigua]